MQAARGAAVDDVDGGPEKPRSRLLAHPRTWAMFALIAALLYLVDQATKQLALERLTGRPDVPVVGDLLQLHLTFNPGAAFSLGTRYTVVLSVLAMVATVVVLWVSRRIADRIWAIALAAILAGILGNLTDRMLREPGPLRGHVIDFLQLPHWPVFNVADICISVGAAIVLLQSFRGVQLDGSRVPDGRSDQGDDADQ